jgi:hypothetical protein
MTQPDENEQAFDQEEEEIFNSEDEKEELREEEKDSYEDSYEDEREEEKGRVWGDEVVERKKINAGFQAYLDKQKAKKAGKEDKKEDKEEKGGKKAKPDFLDLDKDGDKKEPMKKAAKEAKDKKKSKVNENFWSSIFGKPTVKDAAHDQLRGQGYSHTGKDEDNYIMFNGQKFYQDQIQYDDYQSTKPLPRVEGHRLIIANPAWSM